MFVIRSNYNYTLLAIDVDDRLNVIMLLCFKILCSILFNFVDVYIK